MRLIRDVLLRELRLRDAHDVAVVHLLDAFCELLPPEVLRAEEVGEDGAVDDGRDEGGGVPDDEREGFTQGVDGYLRDAS